MISSRFRWLKQLHNPEVDSPRGLCKLLKLPILGSLQVVSNWFEILAIDSDLTDSEEVGHGIIHVVE